jgi:[protein-PII] uridylyltransferase
MIRMRHEAGAQGLEVARARSLMIDAMLMHLFDYAMDSYARKTGQPSSAVALVALGGYGRAELCPLSDIDIMFLYSSKVKPELMKPLLEHLVNEVLYILWDCGLKVGHSTRTPEDAFEQARKDMHTKTALLESRRVAGSVLLFDTFAGSYRTYYTSEDPKGYIQARIEDQAQRRERYGDTPFLQEPDIKNGVGGLRDYQNALWMARVKMGVGELSELVNQNYLRRSDLQSFDRAYNFLLRVRNELHYMSRRPTDLMDLATQPRLAHNLGYHHAQLLGRVEQFMRIIIARRRRSSGSPA